MPDPNNVVSTPVIYGWIITGFAWLGTMVWNLHNRLYTDRTAEKIRADNFALEEWNSVRIDIRASLKAFEEELLQICHSTAPNVAAMRIKVDESHMRLVIRWDQLSSALRQADNQFHVNGAGWEALGSGPEQDQETSWDKLSTAIEDIALETSVKGVKKKLLPLRLLGKEISEGIEEAIRIETLNHDPKKL